MNVSPRADQRRSPLFTCVLRDREPCAEIPLKYLAPITELPSTMAIGAGWMGEAKKTLSSRHLLPLYEKVDATFDRVTQWNNQCSLERSEFSGEALFHKRPEDGAIERRGLAAGVIPALEEGRVLNG